MAEMGMLSDMRPEVVTYPRDGYSAKHNVKVNPNNVERALALWLARGGPCSKKLMDALVAELEAEDKANSSRRNPRTAGTHFVPPSSKAKAKPKGPGGVPSQPGPPPPPSGAATAPAMSKQSGHPPLLRGEA